MDINILLPVIFVVFCIMEIVILQFIFKPTLLKQSKDGILTKQQNTVLMACYLFIVMMLAAAAYIYVSKPFA